jgi:hypothetical protein
MVVGEAEGADCRQPEEVKTRETRRRTDCKRGKHRKRDRTHRTPLVYILPPLLQPRAKLTRFQHAFYTFIRGPFSQLLPCRSMTQLPKSLDPTSLPAFVPDCVPHEAPEAQCLDLTLFPHKIYIDLILEERHRLALSPAWVTRMTGYKRYQSHSGTCQRLRDVTPEQFERSNSCLIA